MYLLMNNFLFLLIITFLLTGCNVGPIYQPPEMDIPDSWNTSLPNTLNMAPVDHFVWWESLNDPQLNLLIQRASEQNLDVYIAGTRILESRTLEKGLSSDIYPHIDASLTCGGAKFNKKLFHNLCHNHSKKGKVGFFEMGFDAEWEIDLFGYRRHEINASEARTEAVEESFNDIWTSLTAEIAKNYIELRSLQQRLILSYKNIENQEEFIQLTKELLNIGIGNAIDLSQSEAQLNLFSAQKPLLELAISRVIHRLSTLLGKTPGELFCELYEPAPLPTLPCEKPIGIPSELLRRRPDIRRAERELAAATESIGSAVSALYPRLSLYGFVGSISTQLKNLASCSSATLFAAPQLLFPIFNSRLLQQDVDLNKIKTQRAIFEYQKTVLTALEEVENGIATFKYDLIRNEFLEKALQTNQESYALVSDLYNRGINSYFEVLATERSLIAAEETYQQNRAELLFDYIALYKALGGGIHPADFCCH